VIVCRKEVVCAIVVVMDIARTKRLKPIVVRIGFLLLNLMECRASLAKSSRKTKISHITSTKESKL
jgi:hypothetical protein